MKTSIFVFVLIVVIFMAGALILNFVYQKRAQVQKNTTAVSESFEVAPATFAVGYAQIETSPSSLYKPIVMDLGFSNSRPF